MMLSVEHVAKVAVGQPASQSKCCGGGTQAYIIVMEYVLDRLPRSPSALDEERLLGMWSSDSEDAEAGGESYERDTE